MLEVYPSLALEIWDRFDHVFIADLLKETAELKKSINDELELDNKKEPESEEIVLDPATIEEFRNLYKTRKCLT